MHRTKDADVNNTNLNTKDFVCMRDAYKSDVSVAAG